MYMVLGLNASRTVFEKYPTISIYESWVPSIVVIVVPVVFVVNNDIYGKRVNNL